MSLICVHRAPGARRPVPGRSRRRQVVAGQPRSCTRWDPVATETTTAATRQRSSVRDTTASNAWRLPRARRADRSRSRSGPRAHGPLGPNRHLPWPDDQRAVSDGAETTMRDPSTTRASRSRPGSRSTSVIRTLPGSGVRTRTPTGCAASTCRRARISRRSLRSSWSRYRGASTAVPARRSAT